MYSLLVGWCLSFHYICDCEFFFEECANQMCAFTTFQQHSNEHKHTDVNTMWIRVANVHAIKRGRVSLNWINSVVLISIHTKLDENKWDTKIYIETLSQHWNIFCICLVPSNVTNIQHMKRKQVDATIVVDFRLLSIYSSTNTHKYSHEICMV